MEGKSKNIITQEQRLSCWRLQTELENYFVESGICLEVRLLNAYNSMEKYDLQVWGLMKEFQMTGFCGNTASSCTDMSHCSCVNNTKMKMLAFFLLVVSQNVLSCPTSAGNISCMLKLRGKKSFYLMSKVLSYKKKKKISHVADWWEAAARHWMTSG